MLGPRQFLQPVGSGIVIGQRGQQYAKIRRQRRQQIDGFTADRMHEGQAPRVQRLAAKAAQRVGQARRGAGRNDQPAAVGRITDQRMAHMRHVHADLVRAAGLEAHGDDRCDAQSAPAPGSA